MFSEFSNNTSCHGIPQIYNSKSWKAKAFWTLILLVFAICLVSLIANITKNYFANPTVTDITISKPANQMEMPKVIVCQDRKLSLAFLEKHNISDALAAYIEQVIAKPPELSPNDELEKEYKELLKQFPKADVREVFFEGGPNCSFLLAHCSQNGKPMNCCEEADNMFDRTKGKCFLFKNLTDQEYPDTGFEVEMKLTPEEYFFSPSRRNTIGITIKILPSYNPLETSEITVPPGFKAMFQIEKEEVKIVNGLLESLCDERSPKNKDASWCESECKLKLMAELSNCTLAVDISALKGEMANLPICSPKEHKQWVTYWHTNITKVMVLLQFYEIACVSGDDEWQNRPRLLPVVI